MTKASPMCNPAPVLKNAMSGTPKLGSPNSAKLLAIAFAVTLLGGCAVGPDYARPQLPASSAYSPTALPSTTASAAVENGAAQKIILERDIQSDWWTLFQSPPLNALIQKAFAANPTIESAQAALRIAQENVKAQQGFFFPTVQAGYSPTRTKIAGNLGGNSPGVQGNGSVISTTQGASAANGGSAPFNAPVIYNFHTAQLTVGFVPDVFGSNTRQVESLQAQAEAQQFQLQAAYVTLASNIVAAAFQDALFRRQIVTTQEIIAANLTVVELLRRQLKAGYVSGLDLAIQETALAQARQLLPPLKKQFEQNRDLLRALSGSAQDVEVSAFEMEALRLPEELPLSLPSQLIEQRPDIRAAEAQLRSASAQLGVATAARLPQFSISATAGGAANRFSEMFWNSGQFFNLAFNIAQPIFDGGTLLHRQSAAREGLRQATAQYRFTVISAYQNVADSLQAIHADAEALKASLELVEKSKVTLDLTRRQYSRGYLDRLVLIAAEQTYRQGLLSLAQAQAARLGDTATLFQALGGGWWHRADLELSSKPNAATVTQ